MVLSQDAVRIVLVCVATLVSASVAWVLIETAIVLHQLNAVVRTTRRKAEKLGEFVSDAGHKVRRMASGASELVDVGRDIMEAFQETKATSSRISKRKRTG